MKLKALAYFVLITLVASCASAQQSPSFTGAVRGGTNSSGDPVDWPQFNFDAAHDGFNSYETTLSAANVKNVTLKWSYTPPTGSVKGQPVVANGAVYFVTGNYFACNAVYAVNADTGAFIWQYGGDCVGPIFASPAVSNGVVYVADNGYLYALDSATGALIWQYPLTGAQYSSPTVVNGVVYVTAMDKNVYALNATTGTLLWKYATAAGISNPAAVANGLLYVSSGPGIVYALNAGTGALIWKKQFGGTVGPSPSLGSTQGGQSVANGVLYVEVQKKAQYYDVYALDASSGTIIWHSPLVGSVLSTPAVANGIVYIATGSLITALNASTGANVWLGGVRGATHSPIVANGVIYAGSWELIGDETGFGTTTAIDASNGSWLWDFSTRGAFYDGLFPTPAVVNGTIYSAIAPDRIGAWSLPSQ